MAIRHSPTKQDLMEIVDFVKRQDHMIREMVKVIGDLHSRVEQLEGAYIEDKLLGKKTESIKDQQKEKTELVQAEIRSSE